MKKTLVAVGAASSLVLGVVPAITPAVTVANVYAATGETTAEAALAKVDALMAKIKTQVPDIEAYSQLSGYIVSIYVDYACSGKGCAVDSYTDQTTGERVNPKDELDAILTAAGHDPAKMDTFERVAALKATDSYKNDAKVKEWVDGIESDIDGMVFGHEGYEEFSMLYNLPSFMNKDNYANKTAKDIVRAVEAIPHIDEYLALGMTYSSLKYLEGADLDTIDSAYDAATKALSDLDAAIANSNVPATPEQTAAEKELSEFVATTRKNPLFQKYERLVNAVRNARALYAAIQAANAEAVNSNPVPVQRDAATPAVQTEGGMGAAEDDYAAELVAAVREIGEALRALGIETDLGTKENVSLEDLKGAFEQTEKIENYQDYADLVDAVYAAEAALASGNVSANTLKEILATVKTAAKKVLPPDTGVAPLADYEVSATAGFPAAAIVATLAATAGAAVVLKRRHTAREAE